MRAFAAFHPGVLFLYFAGMILVPVLTLNPAVIGSSLLGGVLFFCATERPGRAAGDLAYYFFVFLFIAVLFPLFSHNGVTPLFFLNGNPVTLEAVLYGLAAAGAILAVIFWCKCYTKVMTSDKFIYLFGRISPKLSLYAAMLLRYIPDMKAQYRRIRGTQKTLGLYSADSLTDRLAGFCRIISILISWSLENTAERTAAMRARGYGLKGRRNYSVYTFRVRDGVLLGALLGCYGVLAAGGAAGALRYWYYPAAAPLPSGAFSVFLYSVMMLAAGLPFLIEMEETIRWTYLRSKI